MHVHHVFNIPPGHAGRRLDQALADILPDFSRSRLKGWIDAGCVSVDGRNRAPGYRVVGGERVELEAELTDPAAPAPEPLPLDVIHEDPSLFVINKPAGLVVHPGAGNPGGTLQNALLHRDPGLASLPRGGLVHRLDKDTSGLLVVARTSRAHRRLVAAMAGRQVSRRYRALCRGRVTAAGTIDAPIGRHPVSRTRMAVVATGRPARTRYEVLESFRDFTLLDVALETGRTHQIRVHLAHIGHALMGDPVYGGRAPLPPNYPGPVAETLKGFRRQALHAWQLGLEHPESGTPMTWACPLPEDLAALLRCLRDFGGADKE